MSFLTILNHTDEGDDDQEVDIFHHFHIHGVCVRVEAECLLVRRCVCATAKHWLQTCAISHFLLWKCGSGLIQMGVNKKAWYFLFTDLCKANYVAQTLPYSLHEIYISIRWLTFTFESPNVPPVAVKRLDWCIGNELLRSTHLLFDPQFC